jgi:hypothetical protein
MERPSAAVCARKTPVPRGETREIGLRKRPHARLGSLLLTVTGFLAAPPSRADGPPTPQLESSVPAPARDAATVTRDGTFLPTTLAARIGDQRIAVFSQGGYDTAPAQGAVFSTVVEGAVYNRVALRAGIEYSPSITSVSPSVGVRVGILRQEKFGIDLGFVAQYKNLGFSEASGEFEFLALLGHRWNRLGLFANIAYGQGLDAGERDVEARLAFLYAVHRLVNVGVDARARIDLGEEDEARDAKKLTSQFDFIGGPLVTVAVSQVMFMVQAGAHALVVNETAQAGFAAIGGIGTAF